jgi:2-polyprenyl-6-methoxyphenol hydroxylase-like FAD-dependent oxidoreductase
MQCSHDVAVIGGAIAGASTAFLLKRKNPSLRILIIEKTEEFDRKVGESTSEVGACFLMRVLNLGGHLGHEQITKSGLRMWFYQNTNDSFTRCAEIGPKHQTRLPAFQLDRSKLDEAVLQKAIAAGCELWRPAKVQNMELGGEGKNQITVRLAGETRALTARWVIDATGRTALIARKLKLHRTLEAHPIHSVWARFRKSPHGIRFVGLAYSSERRGLQCRIGLRQSHFSISLGTKPWRSTEKPSHDSSPGKKSAMRRALH